MKKIIIYSMLIILFISLASALDSLEIKKAPITKFIGDISYVNHTKADVSQEPYTLTARDIANIKFTKHYNETSFDICFDFPVYEDYIVVKKLEKKGLIGLFNTNLNELNRSGKRICGKTFSNSGDVDIDYQLMYNGIGTIKYNVSILPSIYNLDYKNALANNDLVVLDPYLVGDLNNSNELLAYFPFDGNIKDVHNLVLDYTLSNNTLNLISVLTDDTLYFGRNITVDDYIEKVNIKYNVTGNITTCSNWFNITFYYDNGSSNSVAINIVPVSGSFFTGNFTNPYPKEKVNIIKSNYLSAGCGSALPQYVREVQFNITLLNINLESSYRMTGFAGYDFKLRQDSNDVYGTADGTDADVIYNSSGVNYNGVNSTINIIGLDGWNPDSNWSIHYEGNVNELSSGALIGDGVGDDYIFRIHFNCIYFRLGTNQLYIAGTYETGKNILTITHNQTDNNISVYKNGVYYHSGTWIETYTTIQDFVLGYDHFGYFNGSMDKIIIYNKTLSPDEILALSNNGTYVNNSIDETNKSIDFDGNNYVVIENGSIFDKSTGENLSISMWIKPSSQNTVRSLIVKGLVGSNWAFLVNTVDNLYFFNGENVNTDVDVKITENVWQHFVFVVDDSSFKIYKDGVYQSGGSSGFGVENTNYIYLGENLYYNIPFIGSMDEVMLFNYALSETEIKTLAGGYESAINITVRDEETNNIISTSEVTYYNENTIDSRNTTNGTLFINGLAPGGYTWVVSATGYTTRKYNFVVQPIQSIIQQETVYLTQETNTVIFTYKNKVTGQVLENVNITMSTIVNNQVVVVESLQSDITGRAQFTFTEGSRYIFDSVISGYINKSFELNPIIFTSYTIEMDPTTTIEDSIQGLGIGTIYIPHRFSYNDTRTLNYTISSPGGTLINYSLNITYNGVSSVYNGTTATGETLNHTYNLSNISAEYFIVSYDYYSVETGYKSFSYPYRVLIINNSANNTLENMRANAYGIGLFERVLIVVVSSIVTAGIVSFAAGPVAGGAAGLLLMGAFVYLKLISIWLIIIPLIVGFILIVKGSG